MTVLTDSGIWEFGKGCDCRGRDAIGCLRAEL